MPGLRQICSHDATFSPAISASLCGDIAASSLRMGLDSSDMSAFNLVADLADVEHHHSPSFLQRRWAMWCHRCLARADQCNLVFAIVQVFMRFALGDGIDPSVSAVPMTGHCLLNRAVVAQSYKKGHPRKGDFFPFPRGRYPSRGNRIGVAVDSR